ncbi:MAG: PDDEXK nuclease domain-containing protein [Oscillospiraceae bacterium]|nr:PDDEXK nuclease domain-containing protein [Oscillospiraceae bacterium]
MENGLQDYGAFIKEIKELIYQRQYEALRQVNAELIQLYWDIGAKITERQKEKGWGKSVVDVLARELQAEFPDVQGFSARNLWRMRGFYQEYSSEAILPPMVAEISWTKNIVILEKCKDPQEREFYIKMTKRYGWTKDVLINHIENRSYEKFLLNQTNFDATVPAKYRLQAKLAVKDDYNFDFIEMGEQHSEAELEAGLINNIRAFLTEMGGDYAFIGNQHHLEVDGDDYYIDLLLFHRRLRSLIALELKVGEFKPEYAGKMQFYLTALDETVKLEGENPSIGIIICKNKKRTTVEYALKPASTPIGVASYAQYNTLPEDLKSLLPSPEEIAERLTVLDDELSQLDSSPEE